MKELLYKMFEQKNLSREEAHNVLLNIADGKYNNEQLAAFMTVFMMRSITTDELIGFRDAILDRQIKMDLPSEHAIDIVGTGGDGKNTFNISTATCFVVAGTGRKVIKHGNFGASSISGASNVLQQMGAVFTTDIDKLKRSLDTCGMCYLHAPFFSPALKSVAPIRKALAVRTFFNILGPLVNPVQPHYQLLGVYNLKLMRLYHYISQHEKINCTVVHSLDGYDEISLTSPFKIASTEGEHLYLPQDIGFSTSEQESLSGGASVEDAAKIFSNVLNNKATNPQRDCVLANAAFAINTLDSSISIPEAIAQAKESIESGRALEAFKKFIAVNS